MAVEAIEEGRSGARPAAVVLLAAVSASLVPLNSTLITLGLPAIARDLDVTLGTASWLVTAYLVTTLSVQALAGRAGDLIGRIRSLRIGLVAFALTSVGAAVAGSIELLLVWRTLQAACGALVFANGLALVRSLPAEGRARRMAMVAAVFSLAPAVGLLIGGIALDVWGWQALFLINLPLVAVALVLSRIDGLPHAPAARGAPFDRLGALLLFALAAGSAVALALSDRLPVPALVATAAALAALAAAWLRVERRHPDPVLQPRFFGSARFSVATCGLALGSFSMYAVLLSVPVFVVGREGEGVGTGAMLAAFTGASAAIAIVGGKLAERVGAWLPATLGLGLVAAAELALGLGLADSGGGVVTGCLVVVGAGLGLSNPALFTTGLDALDEQDAGVASGVLSSGRMFGSISAASLFAAVVGDTEGHAVPAVEPLLLVAAAVAFLAAVLASRLRSPDRARTSA